MVLMLAVGLAGVLLQAPAAPEPAVVSGVVLEQGTRRPVSGARVDLMLQFDGPPPPHLSLQPRAVMSDSEGRFAFPGVTPGRYRLNAQKAGFAVDMMRGAPPLAVGPGAQVDAVEVLLTRGGVIVGRVVDAAGEAVSGVRVMTLRPPPPMPAGARGGLPSTVRRPAMMMAGPGAEANELGEFRLHSLLPGDYFLQVVPSGRSGAIGAAGAVSTMFVPTYFPGTAAADDAQLLTVAAGTTSDAGEIRMQVAAAFQVSGTVVDTAGKPVAGAMVRLAAEGEGGMAMMMGSATSGQVRTDARGAFVLEGVTKGQYTLIAVAPRVIGVAPSGGASSMSVVGGSVAGNPRGGSAVRTETRNGTTVEFREALGTRVPLTIADDAVSGVQVVVQRP